MTEYNISSYSNYKTNFEIKTASFLKIAYFPTYAIKHMLDLFHIWYNQKLTFGSRKPNGKIYRRLCMDAILI